jgi:hypothetical protein
MALAADVPLAVMAVVASQIIMLFPREALDAPYANWGVQLAIPEALIVGRDWMPPPPFRCVRFGSLADIKASSRDVRFAPKIGHSFAQS